jgi:ectoine hydroxylase
MKLSDDLTARFARDGYLFFPGLFSAEELRPLRRALERMSSRRGPEVIFEPDRPGTLRVIFGVDVHEEAYRRLRSHPSLLTPVEQLLRTRSYIYQSRINFNSGFAGGGWGWHQDFNQWFRQDGLQQPRALLVGVFLDEINACNAPLMVIPGSHRGGHIYVPDRMEIDEAVVAGLVREGGIDALLGPAGSAVFLHPNNVHGSTRNITPWPRCICYFIYNSVENTSILHPRGNFRCTTDFTPLSPMDDRCLAEWTDGYGL